ncbi:MAG: YceI family protein [Pseudomonadota bacterium]
MTRFLATTALAVSFASSAFAASLDVPSGTYAMDNTHASLVWKVNHIGLSNYTAKLTDFDVTINLDAENVANSSVSASANPLSVTTNFPNADQKDFDAELSKGANWLNGDNFPTIEFASTGIEVTGDNTGTMTGDLTFLGITKPVTFDLTLHGALPKHPFAEGAALGMNATGTFKRSEFGMTHLLGGVGDDVEIVIEAEFIEQK